MIEPDEIDALAAEYALGSLSAAERATAAARRLREPALDAAIEQWERRFAPLNEMGAPVEPPAAAWAGIAARLSADAPGEAVIDLRRRLQRWRVATIAMSALAASLAVAIGLIAASPRPQARYVAVLQKDAASPAFIVSVDLASRALVVRALAAPPRAGRNFELWLIDKGLSAPRSLGLIGQKPFTSDARLAGYDPAIVRSATYAVTEEQQGGSPSGAPTGPVVFSGTMVQVTP